MNIQVALGSVLVSLFVAPVAQAWECIADVPGEEICVMIPNDAPATSNLPLKKSESPAPISGLVSDYELKGDALSLDNEFTLITSVNPVVSGEQLEEGDLFASTRSLELLRGVESFLKSGPSSGSPDIRVLPAGKKK